jgi:hypothetical protein
VPQAKAEQIADTPAVGSLFAAFLGYNPMEKLLSAPGAHGAPSVLSQLPKDKAANVTGKEFFPHLISQPFKDGLEIAFTAALIMCLIAAAASWMRGGKYVHDPGDDDVGPYGAPLEPKPALSEAPEPEEWVPA